MWFHKAPYDSLVFLRIFRIRKNKTDVSFEVGFGKAEVINFSKRHSIFFRRNFPGFWDEIDDRNRASDICVKHWKMRWQELYTKMWIYSSFLRNTQLFYVMELYHLLWYEAMLGKVIFCISFENRLSRGKVKHSWVCKFFQKSNILNQLWKIACRELEI